MAWTIPDKGEGDNDIQSVCFQEMLEVLVAGISGTDCVLSGLAVTGGADMTPAVAKGAVLSNGTLFAVAAADVTITTADATNPRLDLIVVTSAGALAVRAGTAGASPKPPNRTANDVVIALVYVPANDTAIATSQITDMRVFRSQGPIRIAKVTTPVTFTTTNVVQNYFSCTIPNGMFLTGRTMRFRCGGTLINSTGANRQWTFAIRYGATVLWQAQTAAIADSARRAWRSEFELFAESNTAQNLSGKLSIADATAPTTGYGPLTVVNLVGTDIHGAITSVDSDAGNNDLEFRVTMSTSSASMGTTMSGATLELL